MSEIVQNSLKSEETFVGEPANEVWAETSSITSRTIDVMLMELNILAIIQEEMAGEISDRIEAIYSCRNNETRQKHLEFMISAIQKDDELRQRYCQIVDTLKVVKYELDELCAKSERSLGKPISISNLSEEWISKIIPLQKIGKVRRHYEDYFHPEDNPNMPNVDLVQLIPEGEVEMF